MIGKIKGFLGGNKGKILLVIAFIVGGLQAVGVNVPEAVISTLNGLVGGL
jgi:hypothetical protein